MADKISMQEIKTDLKKLLERIFMERKVADDLGLNVREIDDFIIEEGARQKQRFEEISTEEMIDLMITEIASYNFDNLI